MNVEFGPGEGGSWAVKTAFTAEDRSSLRREADALTRAAHPGVVELRAVTETSLTTASAGSHTLADLDSLTPEEAAGLGAAVATILADLHDLGLVHRAVSPPHIILAPGGRPVLCGFSRSALLPDADPGQDVRALATLLLERTTTPPRRLARTLNAAAQGGRRFRSARAFALALGTATARPRLPAGSGSDLAAGRQPGDPPASTRLATVPRPADQPETGRIPIRVDLPGGGAPPEKHPSRFVWTLRANRSPEKSTRIDGPRPNGPHDAGRRTTVLTVLLAVVLAVALAGATARLMAGGAPARTDLAQTDPVGQGTSPSPGQDPTPVRRSSSPRPAATLVACPAVDEGCGRVPVEDGRFRTARGTFEVSLRDLVVVLGRWTCSPTAYPAALDRQTGRIWVWLAWPQRGRTTGQVAASIPGAAGLGVLPQRSGCDRLLVSLAHRTLVIDPGGRGA